jgi:hypothetical protein
VEAGEAGDQFFAECGLSGFFLGDVVILVIVPGFEGLVFKVEEDSGED